MVLLVEALMDVAAERVSTPKVKKRVRVGHLLSLQTSSRTRRGATQVLNCLTPTLARLALPPSLPVLPRGPADGQHAAQRSRLLPQPHRPQPQRVHVPVGRNAAPSGGAVPPAARGGPVLLPQPGDGGRALPGADLAEPHRVRRSEKRLRAVAQLLRGSGGEGKAGRTPSTR